MREKNEAVITTLALLSRARELRDDLLYRDSNCVVSTTLLIKFYVSSISNANSNWYKRIKRLKFSRPHK